MLTDKHIFDVLNYWLSPKNSEQVWQNTYAKVSDHEHSKVFRSSDFQLFPNKVKIFCEYIYNIFWKSWLNYPVQKKTSGCVEKCQILGQIT